MNKDAIFVSSKCTRNFLATGLLPDPQESTWQNSSDFLAGFFVYDENMSLQKTRFVNFAYLHFTQIEPDSYTKSVLPAVVEFIEISRGESASMQEDAMRVKCSYRRKEPDSV